MNNNRYHHKHSDEFDNQSTWCHRNWCRLLIVIILAILTIGTIFELIFVLHKDYVKEKALAEKKKGWVKKWKIIEPYVKKFPLGFLLGFIRNLIVLAIERQAQF
ncbi:unnamed protein product [Adineta steineri]|uniref:Uncharacterized protein n=1 Tax=Adineta steineri TaxID=433720 RepID=A0A814LRG7_9BILA|nr:unnamed protein product [Adineta steineri]CAF3728937.1 unnamed protein product [Adineta steineri]